MVHCPTVHFVFTQAMRSVRMRPLVCFIATESGSAMTSVRTQIGEDRLALTTDQDVWLHPVLCHRGYRRHGYDLCLTFGEYPYRRDTELCLVTHPSREERARYLLVGPYRAAVKEIETTRRLKTIWLAGGSALVGEAITHDLLA